MRRNPMARTIIGASALALLTTSAVVAQPATPPPDEYGPTLQTAVVTNALDDASINQLIEDTVREYHLDLGGKVSSKKNNGWFPVPPLTGTDAVVQGVLEQAQEDRTVVVISGGDAQSNVGLAGNFDATVFIDLGQSLPCVTEDGQADPSGTCAGGAAGIPYNYAAVDFAVEDGAYLTGVLAAAASRIGNERIAVVSGTPECRQCNRYVQGFVEGARATNPNISIEVAYLADDEVSGFSDPATAKTFTSAFVEVFQPDVVLAVGRAATPGIVEAVCEAGKLAVGTHIDVSVMHDDLDCVLASVTTDMATAIEEALYAFADADTVLEPAVSYDLANDRVRVTEEWKGPRSRSLPVDTAERYLNAVQAVLTGQVNTCPGDCGEPLDRHGEPLPDEPAEDA